MVAPKARDIFNVRGRHVGIIFDCPECGWMRPMRLETPKDHPPGECPPLAGKAGPLGFILRCDGCGMRVEMKGSRLATAGMLADQKLRDDMARISRMERSADRDIVVRGRRGVGEIN